MIPPRRIIAGIDFSEASRDALVSAISLARQCDADVHVVHALDPELAAAAARSGSKLPCEAIGQLRAFAADVSPSSPRPPQFDVLPGDTATGLIRAAEREGADLIVIGKQGLARDNGLEFGSSVDSLLRLAPLPVLVVPAGRALQRGPVIVGVDFTEPSLLAALAGVRFAAVLQTDTLLVHVVPDLPTLPRWREHATRAIEQRDAAAARDLDLAVRALPKLAPVSLHVDGGSIPRRLVEAARARDAAMLVLGRQVRPHGYGPPGSIAYRVLTLADVPVLMHVPVA